MSIQTRHIGPGLFILLVSLVGGWTVGDEPSAGTFHRAAILQRFDADQNGELSASERGALRAAYGAIDVPLLPSPPLEYTRLQLPQHFEEAHLRELDNTPADNPTTNQGAALGRVLFYDRQLSRNQTIACASCHKREAGFSDPKQFSVGFAGGHTKRNSMNIANLRYTNLKGRVPGFFWDERAATLEDQVLMPIQDAVEMGMKLGELEEKLRTLPYYPPLFQAAFGSSDVTRGGISKALAQFLRAMTSTTSRFDQLAAEATDLFEDFAGLTAQENEGKRLFMEGVGGIAEFACAMCHVPPTFNMPAAMNIGLTMNYKDPGLGALGRPSNDPFTPSNDGKFRAPSLRNITLTAPYMHAGQFKTLEEVVKHYSAGVRPHRNLGLAFEPPSDGAETSGFRFTSDEIPALVAFLKTLTDTKFLQDERFADPFVREEK